MSKRKAEDEEDSIEERSIILRTRKTGEGNFWSELGSYAVGFTIDFFARLSSAGVEALTLGVAQRVLGTFKLSPNGEERVQSSVARLTSRPAFQPSLIFGFGERQMIRAMVNTAEGLSCIAICACLSECYDTQSAAQILRELFNSLYPPRQLSPSLRQWVSLVRAFQGVLSTSDFGLTCDKLSMLFRHPDEHLVSIQEQKDFKAIARALDGLINLSDGSVKSMTMMGGIDCAWFGAVAEWLFDIHLMIYRFGEPQKPIYDSRPSHGDMQGENPLMIIYFKDLEDEDATPPTHLDIIEKCYIVEGKSLFNLDQAAYSTIFSWGRIEWKSLFEDTFGSQEKNMVFNDTEESGALFGCAARIFELFNEGFVDPSEEQQEMRFVANPPLTMNSGSFGEGLLRTAAMWLPEILESNMFIRAATDVLSRKLSSKEILSLHNDLQVRLSLVCLCQKCKGDRVDETTKSGNTCLRTLQILIWRLTMMLSCVYAEGTRERMLPTRLGIEELYGECRGQQETDEALQDPEDTNNQRALTTFRTVWCGFRCPLLRSLALLFTGRRVKSNGESIYDKEVAVCAEGFVLFRNLLLRPSDNLDNVNLVNIIPGTIEFNNHRYEGIKSGHFSVPVLDDHVYVEPSHHHTRDLQRNADLHVVGQSGFVDESNLLKIQQSQKLGNSVKAALEIREHPGVGAAYSILSVAYVLSLNNAQIKVCIEEISSRILGASFGAACDMHICNLTTKSEKYYCITGDGFVKNNDNCVIVRATSSVASRWLSISQNDPNLNRNTHTDPPIRCILQSRRCLRCCVKQATEMLSSQSVLSKLMAASRHRSYAFSDEGSTDIESEKSGSSNESGAKPVAFETPLPFLVILRPSQ